MSSTRRPPAGYYRGGLAGWAHDPTVGLLGPAGLCIHEDWLRYSGGGTQDYGEVGWTRALVGGSGVTVLLNTPTAATEAGVLALRTSTTANRGGTLHTSGVVQVYEPPVGMVWATKLDLSSTSSVEAWSGLSSSTTGRVRSTDSTQFVGVRYLSSVGQWQGVCKNGSGTANETTVSLGTHSAGTFRILGFEVVDTDGAGTPGVQFFALDASDRRSMVRTDYGDPITDDIPLTTGLLAAGVVTLTNGQRILYQDFYSIGGRVAR
jgi:hypothetical protein